MSLIPLTTTAGQLADARHALKRLADEKMPIARSLHLARLLHLIGPEVDLFEAKRVELLQQHGELTSAGTHYLVKADHAAAFSADLEALRSVEVSLLCAGFDLQTLPDTVAVTPSDVLLLQLSGLCLPIQEKTQAEKSI